MAIRIPGPTTSKALLVTIGSALLTAAPFLPGHWSAIAAAIGGLLNGKALFKRPGDVKAGQ